MPVVSCFASAGRVAPPIIGASGVLHRPSLGLQGCFDHSAFSCGFYATGFVLEPPRSVGTLAMGLGILHVVSWTLTEPGFILWVDVATRLLGRR